MLYPLYPISAQFWETHLIYIVLWSSWSGLCWDQSESGLCTGGHDADISCDHTGWPGPAGVGGAREVWTGSANANERDPWGAKQDKHPHQRLSLWLWVTASVTIAILCICHGDLELASFSLQCQKCSSAMPSMWEMKTLARSQLLCIGVGISATSPRFAATAGRGRPRSWWTSTRGPTQMRPSSPSYQVVSQNNSIALLLSLLKTRYKHFKQCLLTFFPFFFRRDWKALHAYTCRWHRTWRRRRTAPRAGKP